MHYYGGDSYPNADVVGAFSSIDGKTLEEVTGLSYSNLSIRILIWECIK